MVEFYSKITYLWVELGNYVKVPYYTCSKCHCDAANKIIQMYEEEKAHQFLMGLNDDTYLQICSQILTLDPLPSLDRIFNMVVQEENHKSLMLRREDRSESAAAFAVRSEDRVQPTVTEKCSCRHCGRYGHEESTCYELIGYPPK